MPCPFLAGNVKVKFSSLPLPSSIFQFFFLLLFFFFCPFPPPPPPPLVWVVSITLKNIVPISRGKLYQYNVPVAATRGSRGLDVLLLWLGTKLNWNCSNFCLSIYLYIYFNVLITGTIGMKINTVGDGFKIIKFELVQFA